MSNNLYSDSFHHQEIQWSPNQFVLCPGNLGQLVVGGLLLFAAVSKTISLPSPVLIGGVNLPHWVSVGVIQAEFILAMALLCGVARHLTWFASLTVFSVFGVISFLGIFTGAASCGCFGVLSVSPLWMLLIDLGVVSGLLIWRPSKVRSEGGNKRRRVILIGTFVGLAIISERGLTTIPKSISEGLSLSADDHLVILEPHSWVGRIFPLIPYIDTGSRLSKGHWTVLLYHHDCIKCKEALLALTELCPSDSSCFALSVPPHIATDEQLSIGENAAGQLDETKTWFVETPTRIRIVDGIVTAVLAP